MASLDDFEMKLNTVSSFLVCVQHISILLHNCSVFSPFLPLILFARYNFDFSLLQALERNAILENELDEKEQLTVACQRLKDEVRGENIAVSGGVAYSLTYTQFPLPGQLDCNGVT